MDNIKYYYFKYNADNKRRLEHYMKWDHSTNECVEIWVNYKRAKSSIKTLCWAKRRYCLDEDLTEFHKEITKDEYNKSLFILAL